MSHVDTRCRHILRRCGVGQNVVWYRSGFGADYQYTALRRNVDHEENVVQKDSRRIVVASNADASTALCLIVTPYDVSKFGSYNIL